MVEQHVGQPCESAADVASLKASLAALQAKVEELTALQAKSGK